MIYADTHVHLNDDTIYKHLDEVVNDALKENVKLMFVVGWDLESSKKALELAKKYDFVYAIIGFHPCNIRGYSYAEYDWLDKACVNKKVVAIGEIGFDLHWEDTTYEEQVVAFKKQLDIASKHHLPVSIHSRDADQKSFDVLKEYQNKIPGGVLHAYSGSVEMAKEYIKMNFVFGVGGVVTFKNAKTIKEVVKEIDLKYLISETDSPYLTPTPHRGEENSPKYIPLIVDEIAKIKEIDQEVVKEQILKNIERIFKVCAYPLD